MRIAQIAGEELGLHAVDLGLLQGEVPALGGAAREHESRAGGGAPFGDGGADARRGTGD